MYRYINPCETQHDCNHEAKSFYDEILTTLLQVEDTVVAMRAARWSVMHIAGSKGWCRASRNERLEPSVPACVEGPSNQLQQRVRSLVCAVLS